MFDKLAHLFTPHHTNNHRAQILQNNGLALLVGIFVVVQGVLRFTSLTEGIGGLVLGYASSITASQIIDLTNQQRSGQGLSALEHNSALSAAAAAKANHMFANQYWAHIAPDGTSPWSFIKSAGYSYTVAGENLARDFGDSGSVITAWMNSPTHKDNIVNAKYREIGVAVVDGVLNGVETTLVVQMFGSKSQVAAAVAPRAVTTQPQSKPAAVEPTKPAATPVSTPALAPESTPVPALEESIIPAPTGDTKVNLNPNLVLMPPAEASKLRVSPLTITKVLSTSIVALVLLALAYDLFIVHQKRIIRLVGKNWAHFGFFGALLIIMYITTAGQII